MAIKRGNPFSEPIVVAALIGGVALLISTFGPNIFNSKLSSPKTFPDELRETPAGYLAKSLCGYVFVVNNEGYITWANDAAKGDFNIKDEMLLAPAAYQSLRSLLAATRKRPSGPLGDSIDRLCEVVDSKPRSEQVVHTAPSGAVSKWSVMAVAVNLTTVFYLVQGVQIDPYETTPP